MRSISCIALLVIACASTVPGAAATRKAQTLTVRGTVSQNCSLTTSPLSFPSIGIGYIHQPGKTISTQSSLGMRCTKGAAVQIAMDTGLYGTKAGVQFGSRSMKSSSSKTYLGYDLCHDSACASVWSPQGYTYVSPSDAGSSLPVWGRIKTGQQADLGSYSDSVTVTVSF